MSDEYMQQRLMTARPFTVAILHHGPNYHGSEAERSIWEHGRRNMRLQADGVMSIVCPIDDGTDVGGVAILNTDRPSSHDILAADPAVVAGVFTFDLHAGLGFPGDALQACTTPTDSAKAADTAVQDAQQR